MSYKFQVNKLYPGEVMFFDKKHNRIGNRKAVLYMCVKRNNRTKYCSFQKYAWVYDPHYKIYGLNPIGEVVSKKISQIVASKTNIAVETVLIEKGETILDSLYLYADNERDYL